MMPEIVKQIEKGDGLLLVDVQKDFCAGGRLAVENGDQVVPELNRWIGCAQEKGIPIYASRDWHPLGHVSFKEQGGQWPPHCIQDSEGARFHGDLALPADVVKITKGVRLDQDQNSAFDKTGLAERLRRDNVKRLWIGGLALDVCVKSSVLDALEEGFEVFLIKAAAVLAADNDGRELEELPDIGSGIAGAVREYVRTGRSGLLELLEGQTSPEGLLTTVPGIGEELARHIHAALDIDTLEALELAAHDGRLEKVEGIGRRRAEAIRNSVGAILNRSGRRRAKRMRRFEGSPEAAGEKEAVERPSVDAILAVDAEYRRQADAGKLKTIAPRRFNPEGKSRLPIMHTEKQGWRFTALYSNTARAHDLGKTGDWVVIYFARDGEEGQCTAVTEQTGPLQGRRVVRGREKECRDYYSDGS